MGSLLQRFANVRRDEIPALLAGIAYFFCVLTALQVVRPAREALGMRSGLDTVRWLFVGTAVVTLAVNPIFGFLVARYRRMAFIAATYLFFAASLLVFWWLLTFAPEHTGEISGRVFYVWFSVFNLFATMVFWAVMVDRFSLEQSKRLFGIVALGGTLGAMFGPWLAWTYAEKVGAANLILVAVAFLVLSVVAAWVVTRLQSGGHAGVPAAAPTSAASSGQSVPPAAAGRDVIGGSAWAGFVSVIRSPYLLGICVFVLIMTVMATFIYFTRLELVAAMTTDVNQRTDLFAQIDFWTQFATFALQFFITGHIMKRLGVGVAMVLLPVTVSLGFIGLALTGTFTSMVLLEAAFKAMQRGITRPARETLFTVVSREDKYKAKGVVDTFVYRTGDLVGAWTEGALGKLGGGVPMLTALVIPLAVAWAGLSLWLGRTQGRIAAAQAAGEG